jgi:sulfatase maturation enzyme AslB (radical SAM superfamily)
VPGLISNGILWPAGNEHWHKYLGWFRVSLDYAAEESYRKNKGKDLFENVVTNIFRLLRPLLSFFGEKMMGEYREHLPRFNIHFRPWRSPLGRPSINEHTVTKKEVEETFLDIKARMEASPQLEEFIRNHTNVAVNLIVRGVREQIVSFPECYLGLAKTVVRADGSIYPCFRVAARTNAAFSSGNIISDSPERIALRELYIHAVPVRERCITKPEKCLFFVFNNLLDRGLAGKLQPDPDVATDYFF